MNRTHVNAANVATKNGFTLALAIAAFSVISSAVLLMSATLFSVAVCNLSNFVSIAGPNVVTFAAISATAADASFATDSVSIDGFADDISGDVAATSADASGSGEASAVGNACTFVAIKLNMMMN
ncbi:hypothetical protein BLOT_014972 [Blomia tropicalis]|nr:hypothetical protein BLOT_014972 [Blomia tropicalis]